MAIYRHLWPFEGGCANQNLTAGPDGDPTDYAVSREWSVGISGKPLIG